MGVVSDLINAVEALSKFSLLEFSFLALILVTAAFAREWVVVGRAFVRELERGNRLEATNRQLADTLDRLTQILESAKRGR